ncbi:MAG TPA: glucose 1-dehydrogenase [Ilumatobacter sp.]|nr:glucose 1-dehydrogenase [Ilumatobacter sp.]
MTLASPPDRVALVTGAGKGIGAACARRLAAEGAAVGLMDRDRAALDGVVADIDATGGRALAVVGDVSQSADAAAAVEAVVARFGGLDVLVNNAGIQRYGSVDTTDEAVWNEVIGVNLTGVYLMSRYAVPQLRARGGGAIVNTASVQAFASQADVAAYSASKGGVVALTRTMALDHAADRIRVTCIAPGSVRTPMLEWAAEQFSPDDPEAAIAEWGSKHALGSVIDPDDVARLVAFLASDAARAITGSCHVIDAGLLAKAAI